MVSATEWHVHTSVVVSVVVLVSYWLSSVFSVSAGRTSLPGFRKVRIIINNLRLIRIIDKYLMIIITEHDAASLYRSDRFNLKRVCCPYVSQLKTPAKRHVGCENTVIQLDNSANLRGICVTRVTSLILLPPCVAMFSFQGVDHYESSKLTEWALSSLCYPTG